MKMTLLLILMLTTATYANSQNRKVKVLTPYGKMVIRLYDATPLHRNNFIRLIKQHFYDSLLFHRVIRNFMIQGGDPGSRHAKPGKQLGEGENGYTVPQEFRLNLFHEKGVLAAARDDNPAKASSGCQFYIVQGKQWTDEELDKVEETRLGGRKIPLDQREVYKTRGGTPQLDQNYTIFGVVVKGLGVIDKIASVKTDRHDRPLTDIPMKVRMQKKFLFF